MRGKLELELPKRMELINHGTHIEIVRKWLNPVYILCTIFAIIWCLGFSTYISYWSQTPLEVWLVDTDNQFFYLPGTVLTFLSIVGWLSRTHIAVSPAKISIRHRPIPMWRSNVDIDASNLKQLYSKETKVYYGRRPTSYYGVYAITNDGGNKLVLGRLESEEQALYIEQQIEKYLHIKDVSMKGEL